MPKIIFMLGNIRKLYPRAILMLFILSIVSCRVSHNSGSSISKETKLGQSIVKEASKYQGIKYKSAGKTPKGFDCSGYTSYVFRKFEVELSPTSALQAKQGEEVALKDAKSGDLVFFGKNGRRGKVMHVGIVSQNKAEGIYMWHSSSSKGIIETNITTSSYWKPKILYVRRVL